MIFARLEDAEKYLGINKNLDKALKLLTPEFLNSVPCETQYIDDKNLYVTQFNYQTKPDSECICEAHKLYVDIQLLLKGEERVGVTPAETMTLTRQVDDFYAYEGVTLQEITLRPGYFVALFPGDAHKLQMAVGEPEDVTKVVFKVLL